MKNSMLEKIFFIEQKSQEDQRVSCEFFGLRKIFKSEKSIKNFMTEKMFEGNKIFKVKK